MILNDIKIRIKDKKTGEKSSPVSIEELIFNQSEIEFVFDEFDTDSFIGEFPTQIPYKDFLFFKDDYEVIIEVKGEQI